MRNKKRRIKKDKTHLDNQGISIDLHGYRYRDAELIILEHIDEVYYSNLHYVRVIHGHGEGTLKFDGSSYSGEWFSGKPFPERWYFGKQYGNGIFKFRNFSPKYSI